MKTHEEYRKIMHSWGPPYHNLPGSQMGTEEWLINNIFKDYNNGYFVEIGCYNGIDCSNTIVLEKFFGWSGINVEAGEINYNKLKLNRCNIITVNAAVSNTVGTPVKFAERGGQGKIVSEITKETKKFQEKVENIITIKTNTLTNILNTHNAPNMIEYLSVDVEGHEIEVLEGVDFQKYMFLVMQIEKNNKKKEIISFLNKYKYKYIQDISGDSLFLHPMAYNFFKIKEDQTFQSWKDYRENKLCN